MKLIRSYITFYYIPTLFTNTNSEDRQFIMFEFFARKIIILFKFSVNTFGLLSTKFIWVASFNKFYDRLFLINVFMYFFLFVIFITLSFSFPRSKQFYVCSEWIFSFNWFCVLIWKSKKVRGAAQQERKWRDTCFIFHFDAYFVIFMSYTHNL